MKQYISVEELSKNLSVSKYTVYSWTSSGLLPYHKIGKRIIFDPDEVEEWIMKFKKEAAFPKS